MSLLDRGAELVTVYPQEVFTDGDGNKRTRASSVGIVVRATIQPLTSTETMDEGYQTEEAYRFRPVRSFTTELGAQSQVDWNGQRWVIDGEPKRYLGSRRTAHTDYVIRRY